MNRHLKKGRLLGRFLSAALVAGTALTLASCVAEVLVDCIDVRLMIRTDDDEGIWGTSTRAPDTDKTKWYDCIENLVVYIFDEKENFYTMWEGGPYIPGEEYEVPLKEINLPEGVYTFVAWSNVGEQYGYTTNLDEMLGIEPEPDPVDPENPDGPQTPGEPETRAPGDPFSLDDLIIIMETPENGDPFGEDIAHRHHGIIHRAYVSNHSILDPRKNTLVIDPNVHNVKFKVTGLAPELMDDEFTLTVTDANSAHTFRNSFVDKRPSYSHFREMEPVLAEDPAGPEDPENPEESEESETRADRLVLEQKTEIRLMQLQDGTTTRFELRNNTTGQIVRDGDLVKLISDVHRLGVATSDDVRPLNFDETLEFNVELSFMTGTQIEVVINGWRYIWTPLHPGDWVR